MLFRWFKVFQAYVVSFLSGTSTHCRRGRCIVEALSKGRLSGFYEKIARTIDCRRIVQEKIVQ